MFYKKADKIQQETMMNGDWNHFRFCLDRRGFFNSLSFSFCSRVSPSPPWDDGMALSICPAVPLHCTAGLAARAHITGTWRGDVLNHSSCLGVTNVDLPTKLEGVGVDVSQAQMEDVAFGLMFPPLEILGGSARWTQIFHCVFLVPAVSKSEIEVAGRPTSDEYSTSHGWTVTSTLSLLKNQVNLRRIRKMPGSPFELPRFALATLTQCSGTTFRVWTMQEGGVRCTLAVGVGNILSSLFVVIHDMNCFGVFFFGSGQCWLVASKEKR